MKNVNYLFSSLFLLLVAFGSANAKEWRGIVPLRSTLEDVEKLLGKSPVGTRDVYETEEGRVSFSYQSDPDATCGKGYNPYNVPFGTILSVQINSKKKPLLADLNLDLNKFRQYSTCIGAIGYSNAEEGFEMHIYDGAVHRFYYQPTLADRKQFACPK